MPPLRRLVVCYFCASLSVSGLRYETIGCVSCRNKRTSCDKITTASQRIRITGPGSMRHGLRCASNRNLCYRDKSVLQTIRSLPPLPWLLYTFTKLFPRSHARQIYTGCVQCEAENVFESIED